MYKICLILCGFIFISGVAIADEELPLKKKKSKVSKPSSGEPLPNDNASPRRYKRRRPKKSLKNDVDLSNDESSDNTVVAPEIKLDDSRTNRADQGHGYSLLYTPLSDFLLQYGAQIYLARGPSLQIGFLVLTGSEVKETEDVRGKVIFGGSGVSLSIHGRYFLGNSFNILGGLGYRSAALKLEVEDKVLGTVEGDLKVQSAIIPIFIGNQWTWKSGFTFGVDWIGAWIPVSRKTQASFKGDLPKQDLDELTDMSLDIGDGLSKTTSLTLFLTSIGWAF
jgi:hypothetical protein